MSRAAFPTSSLLLRRRRFLQAMGLAGGGLFLPSLLSGKAHAQAAPPKRFVVVFSQHGFVYDSIAMRPPGTTDTTDFDVSLADLDDAQLSRVLRPLAPFKDRLLMIDGLSQCSAEGDVAYNEHDKGTRHALSGAPILETNDGVFASAPTVDQIIADAVAVDGRLRSLEFAVTGPSSGGAIYRGAGQPVPPDEDPRGAFSRLFPPDAGGDLNDADRVRAGQASVLDLVARRYDAVLPGLSGEDRQKLELHRDLIRGAEQRVQALAALQCDRPDEPNVTDDFSSVEHYESRFRAFTDITAAALACDLTRVVSIQLSQLRNDHLGIPGDVHADFAHNSETNADAIEVMSRYGEVHSERHLLQLLNALDSVPEGNGTLLDNTAVLWVSELATGTHKFSVWPALIAGGGNLGLRTGRYRRQVPATVNPTPNPGFGGDPIIGRPHNHLLVSLARLYGADVDAVGGRELFSTEGQRVNLANTLDDLLLR